jgi:putative hydrolase of the HAD superfamily
MCVYEAVMFDLDGTLFDDVDAAFSVVAATGMRVAVLTNGAEHQQTQKIAVTGLAGRVGPLFCCDALGYAKPDPRAYQHVCGALGLACEHVLHVGDHYNLDVLGARAAGLAAVHLDRANRGPHHEPARVTTLNDLSRFLGHDPATYQR